MKKLLLLLLFIPLVSFGQDKVNELMTYGKFYKKASKKQLFERVYIDGLIELERIENHLDSLRINNITFADADKFIHNYSLELRDEAKILFGFLKVNIDLTRLNRGNAFQSLLRSYIIIIYSVFVGVNRENYRKIDKFCANFLPSYSGYTHSYILEQIQNFARIRKMNFGWDLFSKEELDRVFNRKHHPWAIDVSLNDTSWVNEYMKDGERYSDVYLTGIGYYNFFSLYTIVQYTRYILCCILGFFLIKYFRKLYLNKQNPPNP